MSNIYNLRGSRSYAVASRYYLVVSRLYFMASRYYLLVLVLRSYQWPQGGLQIFFVASSYHLIMTIKA